MHKIIQGLGLTEEFQRIPDPIRLGNLHEGGKSRPIRVECETTDQKYMMLNESKTLTRQQNTRNVYIGPDLTRRARSKQGAERRVEGKT